MSDIAAIRAFNRFYTRTTGVLGEQHLESEFSLAETRVLYELAHRESAIASDIAADLGLDRGYLSRLLRRLQAAGLVKRRAAMEDARRSILELTRKGRTAFARLDRKATDAVRDMISPLSTQQRKTVVRAMREIEEAMAGHPRELPVVLRGPVPGDLGWVVERHGAVYCQEYGWDQRFEILVAGIVAQFGADHDPARERCWIAERDGERLGCVFLVKKSDEVAQLRLLLVEPSARGLGLGKRLVQECVRFARECGYRSMILWTQSNLLAARGIYASTGFVCTNVEEHNHFGVPLEAETWELNLRIE